jgi:hypothetical protein
MSMVCRTSATPRHLRNCQYPNSGFRRTDHERYGVCDECEIGGDIVTTPARQVLVAGDWHGNANWGTTLVREARKLGVSTILQLGDFGIWTRRQTNAYLDSLETVAERSTVDIYAIGGNHENYDDVEAFERHRDDGGFVPLRQHVRWVPRGHRWTWDGVRFGGLGGAFSVDWRTRMPGRTWWPYKEELHDEDVERLGEAPLDVLVTHEAPAGMEPPSPFKLARQTDERARLTRARILRAMRRAHPALVLHGHWHLRQSMVVEDHDGHVFRIEGLASDQEANGTSWGVLDLATLELRDGTSLGGA